MSGLGAPARTATPYPERVRFVFESAATLPPAINPSRAAGGAAITSKASPPLIRPTNSELSPVIALSLCPEFFSNSGPISPSTVQMARDAKTFSSADHAVPCGKHTNRYAINESRACRGAIESFSEKIRRGYTGVTRARALPLKYWKIITPRIVRCVIQIEHNLHAFANAMWDVR